MRAARTSHALLISAVACAALFPVLLAGPGAAAQDLLSERSSKHPHTIVTAHRTVKAPKRSKARLRAAQRAQSNLIDHGGPILDSARIYAIWWGKAAGSSSQSRSIRPAVTSFLNGLGGTAGSGLLAQTDQYMRGLSATSEYVKAYEDPGKPPAGQPRISAIVNEVAKVVNAAGDSLEPGALYLVFTTNFPTGADYCAWHSAAAVDGTWIAVGYMPNVGRVAGCASPDAGSGVTRAAQSLINVTSHEILEATTDSLLEDQQGWTDAAGEEIADKCAWTYPTDDVGAYLPQWIGGQPWILQREWSNEKKACV